MEDAVNKRPLTHVGGVDDQEPVTPARLLGNVLASAEVEQEVDAYQLHPGAMRR